MDLVIGLRDTERISVAIVHDPGGHVASASANGLPRD